MTLQTHEEERLLRRVDRCEELLDILVVLCSDILKDLQPRYRPTKHIHVTPQQR